MLNLFILSSNFSIIPQPAFKFRSLLASESIVVPITQLDVVYSIRGAVVFSLFPWLSRIPWTVGQSASRSASSLDTGPFDSTFI